MGNSFPEAFTVNSLCVFISKACATFKLCLRLMKKDLSGSVSFL